MNAGMKMHGVAMDVTMTLHNSAKAIGIQEHLKASELDEIFFRDYTKTKNWSRTPTYAHIIFFAEGLITEVYKRSNLYIVNHVGELEYEVAFDDLLTRKTEIMEIGNTH